MSHLFIKFFRFVFVLSLFLPLITGKIFCQEDPLPRWLTDEEKSILKDYAVPSPWRGITQPPAHPVRAMAEWEELQAVIITWRSFPDILTEIVRHVQGETQVIIVSTNQNYVSNYLTDHGVDDTGIIYLNEWTNSVWSRDYGPNTVYKNDIDSLYLIDWIYNRPRPGDDLLPDAVGELLEVPVYSTTAAPFDLVHTGGNFMSDGLGTGFSSHLVLDENGPNNQWGTSQHDEDAIDSLMAQFMGIDVYPKMTNLPYDGIHHIDMHMKLLDERTLLVGEYPDGVADGPQIEANIQYVLNQFSTPKGNSYRIKRVLMPPDYADRYPDQNGDYRTYANMLFVNNTVLVPVYEEKYDTTAIRVIEEALPGYNVVGIDCNEIIPYGGAIHCITKEVGHPDPLWIAHEVLDDITQQIPGGYPVEARVQHLSGIDSVFLYYKKASDMDYLRLDMLRDPQDTSIWSALIPPQTGPNDIHYYFEAFARSGKIQKRPMPAPQGYFSFHVDDLSTATKNATPAIEQTKVYPNPATANTCIEVNIQTGTEGLTLTLQTVHGQIVKRWDQGTVKPGKHHYFFNAEKLPAGVYFIRIESGNTILTKKVIVE